MFHHPHDAGPRRHHRDPRGPGFRGGPGPREFPFGFRGFSGPGWPRQRARRGEIRPLILAVLTARPMHGYEVIQELESRSGGRWRPSAGSVYPTLQLLEDEGLVTSEEVDGRRVYRLTDEGRKAATASPEPTPWSDRGDDSADVRRLGAQLMAAIVQLHMVGSPQATQEAKRILTDARRQVYRLLAEDDAALADAASDGDDEAEADEESERA